MRPSTERTVRKMVREVAGDKIQIGDLQPYTVTTKGLSSCSGIFRGTNWQNLRQEQNIHHPQDCNSYVHHDFCGGGARIVRFEQMA